MTTKVQQENHIKRHYLNFVFLKGNIQGTSLYAIKLSTEHRSRLFPRAFTRIAKQLVKDGRCAEQEREQVKISLEKQ